MRSIIPFPSANLQSFFDDEFFPRFQGMSMIFPSIDIEDIDDHLLVTADVPGIDKKDIEVYVEDDTLVISGKTQENKEEKKKNFYRKERRTGHFYREVTLPCRVDSQAVKANFETGTLKITLPKLEGESERRKKIEVE